LIGTHPRTIPAKFGVIRFSGFRVKNLNVMFYQNMPNLHNQYKLSARKISQYTNYTYFDKRMDVNLFL
jgi:hypothetical protein